MVRTLRLSPSHSTRPRRRKNGLILANGGVLTYQHAICLSTHPRSMKSPEYPAKNPLSERITNIPIPELAVEEEIEGEAVIEVLYTFFSLLPFFLHPLIFSFTFFPSPHVSLLFFLTLKWEDG